jgi:hypothetical protein
LAQAASTSTAATRAMRFIEMISTGGTHKAQRETAPWYAVLERAEFTEQECLVKAYGTRTLPVRMPMPVAASHSAFGADQHAVPSRIGSYQSLAM